MSSSPMRGIRLFYVSLARRRPWRRSRQIAEIFAWLETDGVAGRNRNFDAGLGIAADPALAALDLENSETTELDAIAGPERRTHRFDDCFDRGRGLRARDLREVHHAVDDVGFDHASSGVGMNYITCFFFKRMEAARAAAAAPASSRAKVRS